jgi:hypothetical protein
MLTTNKYKALIVFRGVWKAKSLLIAEPTHWGGKKHSITISAHLLTFVQLSQNHKIYSESILDIKFWGQFFFSTCFTLINI